MPKEAGIGASIEEEDARAAGDGKVMKGKDGWLFLAYDTNDVVAQQTGKKLLTKEGLLWWRLLLEARTSWLEKQGIPYFFLVAPDAHAVYSEKLPDGINVTSDRPVYQINENLENSGSFARIIYPIEEILAEKGRSQVYTKTDSHWNALGAYCAYERLAAEIKKVVPIADVRRDDIQFYLKVEPGGLGYKLDPPAESVLLATNIWHEKSRVVYDNQVYNSGSIIVFERDDAPPTTCLLFGDSFSYRMLHYLSGSFRRFVFAHNPSLDFEMVFEEKPDLVISILSEHFLTAVPSDLPPRSTRDREHYKTRKGELRRPVSG